MRSPLKRLAVFLATFVVGMGAVFAWCFLSQPHLSTVTDLESAVTADPRPLEPEGAVEGDAVNIVKEPQEIPNPLDQIWVTNGRLFHNGYVIEKECEQIEGDHSDCNLKIRKNNKTLETIRVEYARDIWLRFGLFNFLGGRDKQLIVHTYSGGAHCCYDYMIYDLSSAFRKIYDSRKDDSVWDDIGNKLFPIDIDGDGVYEFRRHVMRFEYSYVRVFPLAIFEYDGRKKQYQLANKKYSGFIMADLEDTRRWVDWRRKNCADEPEGSCLHTEKYLVSATFFAMIYAGKETDAWQYFEDNYNFYNKEKFAEDARQQFSFDVTFRSIYK